MEIILNKTLYNGDEFRVVADQIGYAIEWLCPNGKKWEIIINDLTWDEAKEEFKIITGIAI